MTPEEVRVLVTRHIDRATEAYGPGQYRFEIYHESDDCPMAIDEEFDCTCEGIKVDTHILRPPKWEFH